MKSPTHYIFILLAALLLFPSAVKLGHVFSGHEHAYCNHYAESHFHQENWDCELFEFHQAPVAQVDLFSYTIFNPEEKTSGFTSFYQFLSEYQKLSYSLRGPPGTV